ncbi:hypothetical protein GUJ93_ZPchr0011g28781 [Zizania palustris]|uniref:Uncharacterized protein n=1 Tax=Zizania palustris TaxID=103762 RepID=A0A8J5WHA8_ZIZPA|nr:hypothetical protein GUJ93_ZPchr0011g28781 [Zizania palustris]
MGPALGQKLASLRKEAAVCQTPVLAVAAGFCGMPRLSLLPALHNVGYADVWPAAKTIAPEKNLEEM